MTSRNNGQFARGTSGNPAGRPRGIVNRVDADFRETVRRLLENNSENVEKWLTQVAEGDGESNKPDPARALDLLAKLAEFAAPKLGRVEHVGDGGGPVKLEEVRRVIVRPSDTDG